MDILRGVVERITYHNEENGYTVAKLAPEVRGSLFGAEREVPIVGNMLGIVVGESVELMGRWTLHAEYGRQFSVETMRSVLPATVAGMEKYLGSGLIRGVGPVTARRIVKFFDAATLDVIDRTPERLIEVPGVGPKRVQTIAQAWTEQRAIKEVMLFLQSHGVTTGLATKIYKEYGDNAIAVVRNDPYRLARDIFGIGFLTADKIARSMGLPPDAPQRIAAGVAYALNQASEDGHLYLPTSELLVLTASLLDVGREQAAIGVARMWSEGQVKVAPTAGADALEPPVAAFASDDGAPRLLAEQGQLYAVGTVEQAQRVLAEEDAIYLAPFYYSEVGVANRLRQITGVVQSRLAPFAGWNAAAWTQALAAFEQRGAIQLAPQQQEAVQTALTRRLTVLTGGPGTGKTTTVRTILQLCQQMQRRVVLAAPTGRAAKRLTETTGHEAKTIHRLLEFKPAAGMTFQRNEENPLEGDLLIVDEASMLDTVLMNSLLKAVASGMHLLLVGDVDQLPSVGPGNVLRDVIAAIEGDAPDGEAAPGAAWRRAGLGEAAAVIRLRTIFRQEAGSFIITNAHRINAGEMPILDNKQADDFFVFTTEDAERAAQLCVELVTERIPRRFGIPPEDIQLLSPMHRGVAGVSALNEALQAALNPPAPNKPQKLVGSRAYRVGDRVMQIRNNYDKDVYNGDMGRISGMDLEMHQVTVTFDGRPLPYDFLELDELVHAYAVSIHKSQGSEFPAVVVPVLTSHYMMLQRNLLYTAVTRARRLVVLVGQPRAIGIAVRNGKVAARYTGLAARLMR
ncbi:MAG: AAA family ATPase [Caldilineaceae bacterium]|nr:AAA family ATPase [Caldilineaceae bacterium]